ncbi:hypothetical protein D5F01_LYC18627 [Xyrichtys novacula]|uniref:Uncharacterized protein n=1 Tax=Xyrichtys novacula TaxID=13765 RepID=A0AAV1GN35_XYRNO|nr:hypothetical protein D5F01_LYC18627 [Xyrichtys novacula]
MPSLRLGHAVYDLTALRLGRAALQLHCISPSTYVVLFGTDQESPNGAQNMEVGWQPKNELEPAKCLWSSSQVNPGQGKTSPHPSSKLAEMVSPTPVMATYVTREEPLFLTQVLSLCNPFGPSCHAAAALGQMLEPERG